MDPLSIASAAVGFVGLAGQLAGGILKLKGFVRDIQSASKEVDAFVTNVEIFQDLLKNIGSRLENAPKDVQLNNPELLGILGKCKRQCNATVHQLERTVTALQKDFAKSRINEFKMLWKKPEIKEASQNVDSCKVSLQLALSVYGSVLGSYENHQLEAEVRYISEQLRRFSRAIDDKFLAYCDQAFNILSHQLSSQLAENQEQLLQLETKRILAIQSIQSEPISGIKRCASSPRAFGCATATSWGFTTSSRHLLEPQTTRSTHEKPCISRYNQIPTPISKQRHRKAGCPLFSFFLPSLRSESQYRFSLNKASSGFGFTLHARMEIEGHTPLMKACFEGDIEKAKTILKASPNELFVQRIDGRTCLHKAVKSGNKQLVSLLFKLGAADRLDGRGKTLLVLSAAAAKLAKQSKPQDYVEELINLQKEVLFRCDMDEDDFEFDDDPERQERDKRVYDLLARHATWTPEERLKTFLLSHSGPPEFSGSLEDLLHGFHLDPYDPYVLSKTIVSDIGLPNMFHLIAKAFCLVRRHKGDRDKLCELAARAVEANVDMHAEQMESSRRQRRCTPRRWKTPLAGMLMDSMHLTSRAYAEEHRNLFVPALDRPFRQWIAFLHRAGVDLEKYGEEETKALTTARFVLENSAEDEMNRSKKKNGSMSKSWSQWFAGLDGFDYGAHPTDWCFRYKDQYRSTACSEFWKGVEDLQKEEQVEKSIMPGLFD